MKLTVRPLTPDLWPAFEDLFGANGACYGCWCMYWRIGRAYRSRASEENKAAISKHRCRRAAARITRLRRRTRNWLVPGYPA